MYLVFDFLKNGLSGVVSYNHLYFSPPLSNFKGGSFEPFEPPPPPPTRLTVEKGCGLLSQYIMGVNSIVFSRVDDSAKHRNMDEQEQDDNVFAEMLSFS